MMAGIVIVSATSAVPSSRCYAPTPAKTITHLPTDDYMAQWAQPLWGSPGRDDLSAIRAMCLATVFSRRPALGSHVLPSCL